MREYGLKEIATLLDTAESTLRRWCQMLEAAGYPFERSENSRRRVLTDREKDSLTKLKKLSQSMPLEEACAVIVSQNGGSLPVKAVEQAPIINNEEHWEKMNQLIEQLPMRIYWSGADTAVKELQEQWRLLQEA
ncbi:hypothetical protein PghCCS26_46280 [Paenibacillus glycanilyticus]|uniref:HTH merR-type domain-containing protein n=1 Tax=Paenibacillus glycanilyticus TaxID=126569 RepID=A0ABQ6NSG4_9BACL|nr:hypothetical protein [Paenibacillus glycanilyticus]GMK47498.1 hypothetical protein PghCCS26_46280 [Paenibacillus glycanilyticus]